MDSSPALPVAGRPPDRRALAALGRALPAVGALERFCRRVAGASAAAALVVGAAVALRVPGATLPAAALLTAALLVPAGAAWLVGSALGDLRRLPGDLAATASAAAQQLGAAGRPRGLVGVVGALWAARHVLVASRAGWGRAVAAARLVRLVRLPFLVGALGLFLLNGVVLVAGAAAAVWLLLAS